MFTANFQTHGLSETLKAVLELPGDYRRAKRSALASVAWMIRGEMRNHVEYGGLSSAPLHPLTHLLRKFKAVGAAPIYYMGRFVRYTINAEATQAQIGYGKREVGDDSWLNAAVERHEMGETIKVTKGTRRAWLRTKTRETRKGTKGKDWFVLRPGTTSITIPKRPLIGPVFQKVQGRAMGEFETKFWAAMHRYATGAAKK